MDLFYCFIIFFETLYHQLTNCLAQVPVSGPNSRALVNAGIGAPAARTATQ
jgi:hypothetical protein